MLSQELSLPSTPFAPLVSVVNISAVPASVFGSVKAVWLYLSDVSAGLQIPVFLTAVMGVRRMSATTWPGFDTGVHLWNTLLDLGVQVS